MAASVRIDDGAFTDERFAVLAALCGLADADHARGKMARLWRQCTDKHVYSLSRPMIDVVLGPGGAQKLIDADLGEVDGELVRVRGTDGRIEWLEEKRAGSVAGGKARAAKAKREGGRFSTNETEKPPADTSDAGSPGPGAASLAPGSTSPPASASVSSPVLERSAPRAPDGPVTWTEGEPIATPAQFEAACGVWGFAAGNLRKSDRERSWRVLQGGPIDPGEYTHAVERARGRDAPIAYMLGVVEGERKQAAMEANKPVHQRAGPGTVGWHPGSKTFEVGEVKL